MAHWREMPEYPFKDSYKHYFVVYKDGYPISNCNSFQDGLGGESAPQGFSHEIVTPDKVLFKYDPQNREYGEILNSFVFLHLNDVDTLIHFQNHVYGWNFISSELLEAFICKTEFSGDMWRFIRAIKDKQDEFKSKNQIGEDQVFRYQSSFIFLMPDEEFNQYDIPVVDLLEIFNPQDKMLYGGCQLKFRLYELNLYCEKNINDQVEVITETLWKNPFFQ